MKMNNSEMMKLFDFILENKNIIIGDNELFNRDTLIIIRSIVKGKIPNNFQLTPEQKQLIIDTFLNSNNIFNEDTPSFIIENEECVKVAIDRNLNSVNFIKYFTPELEKIITNKALGKGFILTKYSPNFLKDNYTISLNSIKLDASSTDFINWDAMNDKDVDNLIDEALKNGYVLSNNSHSFLRSNVKIVLHSIKKEKENIQYAEESTKNNPEVFKYLLLNGYHFDNYYLHNRKLEQIRDKDVLNYCFKQLGVYGHDNKQYIDRFNTIFYNAINSLPSIKSFESVFQKVAEESWEEHKKDNIDIYENILGKICTELRKANDFNQALINITFLKYMEDTLENKYNEIYKAMQEYFNLFHSNTSRKLEKIQPYQDTIARLSALYVSKEKEKHKKKKLEECNQWLKQFYTLRLDNPMINKKIIQKKKKQIFRDLYIDLYINDDKNIREFIYNIDKVYSQQADWVLVWCLIKGFIEHQYSKIDRIIPPPYKYYSYEKYEKAIKLIHRLNRGYIQYEGPEVFNYRDIIKYNNNQKQYVYTGIVFDNDDLKEYNEYRKKIRLFEEIKKDISLKIRSMEINPEIDEKFLKEFADKLPFTDEYFEFNKELMNCFDLWDLCNKCMIDDNGFNIESFISDESFTLLNNVLINNGIIWLLLFMNNDINDTFRCYGISKETIIDLINNMKEISDLTKMGLLDTRNFNEILLLNEIYNCADNESIAILGKDIIKKLYTFKDYTDRDEKKIITMAKELVAQMAKRNKSTVPFINGKTINYKYSMYDSQDETLLLAGINTDACFKIDGYDNDFLHYCALDKNGFVIKITDYYDNFIARAAGFRNGNCIFLNQLRTIYDESGNYYLGTYQNEKNDIIETLRKACEDIVNISHNNPKEVDKIDFVFITKSYSLCDTDSNVSDEVIEKIGNSPMDTESEDWEEFINNTENVIDAYVEGYFDTDYGSYPIICMASSKKEEPLKTSDIKPKNVKAVYERTRNHIIATEHPNINIVNKINGINAYFEETDFKSISIPDGAITFIGDNWYIIYFDEKVINSCVLKFDEAAKIEYEATIKTLQAHLSNNQQLVNIEQFVQHLESQNSEIQVKILRLNHKKYTSKQLNAY